MKTQKLNVWAFEASPAVNALVTSVEALGTNPEPEEIQYVRAGEYNIAVKPYQGGLLVLAEERSAFRPSNRLKDLATVAAMDKPQPKMLRRF